MTRTFKATKKEVDGNTSPDDFLNQLIDTANSLSIPDFDVNPNYDIYSLIKPQLGPWTGINHRKAAMCEALRCLASLESSYNWDEGRDMNAGNTGPFEQETGIFQCSANSMYFGKNLQSLFTLATGMQYDGSSFAVGNKFITESKVNHPFAVAYMMKLCRIRIDTHGPLKRAEINKWLSRDAVEEFQAYFDNAGTVVTDPNPPVTPPTIPTSTGPYVLPSMKDFGEKADWIPWAIRNPNGQAMKTHGTYSNGYPHGLCIHFTDGYSKTGKQAALDTIAGGINDGYAYLVSDRNGVIYQTFPLSQWGYHCGESTWPNLGSSLNNKIVGIEHCSMGQVALRSDGLYGSKEEPGMKETWTKDDVRAVKAEANVNAGIYLKFTDAQEKTLVELILWMAVNSGMGEAFLENVVGHDEISPDRRDDPGGCLSMTTPKFRAKLKDLYKQIV